MRAERCGVRLSGWSLAIACAALQMMPAVAAEQTSAADGLGPDEAAVLSATSGRIDRPPVALGGSAVDAIPRDLDGADLQRWFDRRYGVRAPATSAPAKAEDVADENAERALLADIARRRREP